MFNLSFLAFSFIALVVPLFMIFRNHWVFKKRMEILQNGSLNAIDRYSLYERLPPYNVMVRRWWVWDVNKFLNNEGDNND